MTKSEMNQIRKMISSLSAMRKELKPLLRREEKKYYEMDWGMTKELPKEVKKQEAKFMALEEASWSILETIDELKSIKSK